MIPREVAAAFPASVRARGEEYFASGRVRIARVEPSRLTAVVHGTVSYVVEIAAAKNLLSAMCSCPFAADNGICKHIWATLRLADEGPHLQKLTSA